MASTMDDCVLDFDIDLFQQSPKYDVEKARKSILVTKTKVTSTNSLLKKYYNKGVICKSLEDYLLATKESYKQVCIERIELREKCTALEEEVKNMHEENKELQEKYIAADNRYDGIQSHSKQLELLIKDNETTIQSLKIENQLEISTSKDLEKKYAALQKENDYLIKNISRVRDIVFGKKKATKELKVFLNKYVKLGSSEAANQDENCSEEIDAFDGCSPPLDSEEYSEVLGSPAESKDKTALERQNKNIIEENINNEDDSESSNEVVSTDTGRGSSLAFSDSDKGSLLSPDYFINHSPLSADVISNKHKIVVSAACSPISTREFTDVATSPIIFKDTYVSEQMEAEDIEQLDTGSLQKKMMSNNHGSIIMIDRVVSPMFTTQHVDMSTSTDRNVNCDIGTSPLRRDNWRSDSSHASDHISQGFDLDLNNINSLVDDNSNDGEIQMIFDTMRFNQKLITPIPTTPAKPRSEASTNITTQTTSHTAGACPDAAKIKEENIALQVTVAKLAQEVMNINNILSKCYPSMTCEPGTNIEAQKLLHDKCLSEKTNGGNPSQQKHESKTILDQSDDAVMDSSGGVRKALNFKGKITKLKELFDDSLSSCPRDCPSPESTVAAPPELPADVDANLLNNSNVKNVSFKSKERLRFEDPLSHEESASEMSDREYEHEIVVELTPDSQESDRHSLHEILMEQQLGRQAKLKERPVGRTPRSRKLTRLEKLRKNMVPKSKIKEVKSQEGKSRRKLRVQPKRLTGNKQRVLSSPCTVNDQAAYEKACKVMAELKAKEKVINKVPDVPPENNSLKCVEDPMLSSPGLDNDVEVHRNELSIIRDSVIELQKMSPKNSSIESEKVPAKLTNTPKFDLVGKDSTSPDHKKSLRTRSQSKCINDNEKACNSDGSAFDTNHLKSPALKRYGRTRINNKTEIDPINNNTLTQSFIQQDNSIIVEKNINIDGPQSDSRKRLKRPSVDKPDIVPKRILRSSSVQQVQIEESTDHKSRQDSAVPKLLNQIEVGKEAVSYEDLDLFEDAEVEKQATADQAIPNVESESTIQSDHPRPGILCTFIDKYGSKKMKRSPKISENAINLMSKLLEDSISEIQKLPPKDTKHAMDKLVKDLQTRPPNHLLSGLVKFLKEPGRKIESYNKINVPPAPPMTKVEQILIYIVAQLKARWPNFNIVENILNYIEYTLFMLNRTPEFEAIESLSHFYAVLCRYNKNRNRLRLFIIDAMYCLQYKAVPLIKQCLDVWMHILPLAHLGLAKNPLVICLVYLLHFYKCEDRFNRVQEIRNILHRKYFYEVSEWNEPGILEIIRNSILELRDIAGERKMLRMALIILAKRNGARWCQKHIIKNMLLPIIERMDVPDRIKQFCVALLGPLLKPYPMEMKVNCEIVMNLLFDMIGRNPSPQMQEAIYTSLIYMSRHNQYRVIKALLCWRPDNVSSAFEDLLKNYVKERPVKSWRQVVSKIFVHN